MASKGLALGIGLVVVVGGIAGWQAWKDSSTWSQEARASDSALALPDLTARESEIATVTLVEDDARLVLERAGSGWVLPEKGGYPAKQEKVVELLRGLADIQLVEQKTARPELHEKVGLVDPEAGGEVARRIEVRDGSGGQIGSLLVGNRHRESSKPSVFVRKPGEDQTWLAQGEVDATATLRDWLDRDLLAWEATRVRRATVTFLDASGQPTGETYTAERETGEATDYSLAEVPEGKEVSSPWLIASVARVPNSLRMDDVTARESFTEDSADGTEAVRVVWETFDGVLLTAHAWKVPGSDELTTDTTWARFQAELADWAGAEEQNVPAPPVEGEEDAEAIEPEPTSGPSRAELEAEVTELNERFGPWVYGLESYTGTNLFRGTDELLKDIEPPAEPESEPSFTDPLELLGPTGGDSEEPR